MGQALKQVTPSFGCARILVMVVGFAMIWGLSTILQVILAISGTLSGLARIGDNGTPLGTISSVNALILPGALIFASLVTLFTYVLVTPYEFGVSMGRWAKVSVSSGVAYWLTIWVVLLLVFDRRMFGLEALLEAHYGEAGVQFLILVLIAGVGTGIGALSGALLGVPQWLLVRGHVPRAGLLPRAIMGSSALTVAVLLIISAWISQGGGWG